MHAFRGIIKESGKLLGLRSPYVRLEVFLLLFPFLFACLSCLRIVFVWFFGGLQKWGCHEAVNFRRCTIALFFLY